MQRARTLGTLFAGLIAIAGPAFAQGPDRPVITEVFRDPKGANDGPVGRDPSSRHQEFIELHLPTAAALHPSLNKDALNLTFYEVEGDYSSSHNGLVEYRIDLPTFDLDPSNGLTGLPRPASGIVVIGWVDYTGAPPTALAGTPATRVALIDGGVTSTPGFTFVAVNGAQFGGTTNFPVPIAVSGIDLVNGDPTVGFMDDGASVFLLVNRNAPGYVQRFAYDDPFHQPPLPTNANLSLPTGTVLGVSSVVDTHAANDHADFRVTDQPYSPPTGKQIDLENVLPASSPFSLLAAQVDEDSGHGYARGLLDVAKTTEDANAGNDDPATDAVVAYRTISNVGPFGPNPGRAPFSTSAPELSVAESSVQVFDVLAGTTGRPGVFAANLGGDIAMQATATPGASSDPVLMTVAAGDADVVTLGQTGVHPSIAVTVPATAANGASATAPFSVVASTVNPGDPATLFPNGAATATFRVLAPTAGKTAAGLPFQATSLIAVQGVTPAAAANELLATSLGAFVAAGRAGGLVQDSFDNGGALVSAATNLSSPVVVDLLDVEMPTLPAAFINVASPAGLESLVTTVITSAEQASGAGSYDGSLNGAIGVAAIEVPIPETRTSGGLFRPTERVHFADATGLAGAPTSGLTNASSTRGFELALIESQVQSAGTLETGATDDFGLIVEVGEVAPGASVVPGQFVFLSMAGGFEGADVDSLDVPPHGTLANVVYVDLDLLDTLLGARSINRLFVVDGSGTGTIDLLEVFSLNASPCSDGIDNDGDGLSDHPLDTGCRNASDKSETADCSDGIDNDGDGKMDFDGGVTAGVPAAYQLPPDSVCGSNPSRNYEAPRSCGLGAEAVLVVAALVLRRRICERRA